MSAEADAWARLDGAHNATVLGALRSLVGDLRSECGGAKRNYTKTVKDLAKLGSKLDASLAALDEAQQAEAAAGGEHAAMLALRAKAEVDALLAQPATSSSDEAESDGENDGANIAVPRRAPRAKRSAAKKASAQIAASADPGPSEVTH
jgi:hypothetical protein